VLGPRLTVNQDIVEENQYKAASERFQDGVHQGLESRRGIREDKRHNQEFKQALMRLECSFVNVRRAHTYLVIT